MNRWNRLGFPLLGALLAACNLLPWNNDAPVPPESSKIPDAGPDARRDATFVDLDAGPADYPLPEEFTGSWATLPGLEDYPIWRAQTPSASATPIRWRACSGEIPGCEALVVDWTDAPYGGALKTFPYAPAFYREGGRSFFTYQRRFMPSGDGSSAVAEQTVVEELGVGVRFVLGEAAPFNAIASMSFGGGTFGVAAAPRGRSSVNEYAFPLDGNTIHSAVWDRSLLPFRDSLGVPFNYGVRFAHWPFLTLTDVREKSLLVPEKLAGLSDIQPVQDGFYAVNISTDRIDFIDWGGAFTPLYAPPVGWGLAGMALDRDTSTLVWFEERRGTSTTFQLFAADASRSGFTKRLVRAIDLGSNGRAGTPIVQGDFVAYRINPRETEVVRLSTGETHRVTVPAGYPDLGGGPWYVDDNVIWVPLTGSNGISTMLRLFWKLAPTVR